MNVKVIVDQSCLTLCDTMDSSPPGSSVHGILQARFWSGELLPSPEDVPFSRGSSLLQRIVPTQGLNLGLPHCRHSLYHLSHRETHIVQRSDQNLKRVFKHIRVWGSPSEILFFLRFLLHFPEAELVLFTVC